MLIFFKKTQSQQPFPAKFKKILYAIPFSIFFPLHPFISFSNLIETMGINKLVVCNLDAFKFFNRLCKIYRISYRTCLATFIKKMKFHRWRNFL